MFYSRCLFIFLLVQCSIPDVWAQVRPAGALAHHPYAGALQLIERGEYARAWQQLPPANTAIAPWVKQAYATLLRATILHHQGALFLAQKELRALRPHLARLAKHDLHISEDFYLLNTDICYQLNEFEQFIEEVDELGSYWQRTRPGDSLLLAWYHSLKAKYYSALIVP
ncbi:MAG: hypothetical protein IT240_07735, partial [Bacteroidia bacterium]|nr:hypothetical protein [Bacteroidia bacterium]